jgi:hypothetical protein
VHRNEEALVRVESLAVYPNGFVVNLHLQANPHLNPRLVMSRIHEAGMHIPRVGVRFSDGRTAGRAVAARFGSRQEVPKDANGFPTEPIVGMAGGGGGGSGGWRYGTWVYPLPPEGPVEIFVSVPVAGLDEGSTVVDGGEIRAAAQRAAVVWT